MRRKGKGVGRGPGGGRLQKHIPGRSQLATSCDCVRSRERPLVVVITACAVSGVNTLTSRPDRSIHGRVMRRGFATDGQAVGQLSGGRLESQGRPAAAAVGAPSMPVDGGWLLGEGFAGAVANMRAGTGSHWNHRRPCHFPLGRFLHSRLAGGGAKWAHPILGHGPTGGARGQLIATSLRGRSRTRWRVKFRCFRSSSRDRQLARRTGPGAQKYANESGPQRRLPPPPSSPR